MATIPNMRFLFFLVLLFPLICLGNGYPFDEYTSGTFSGQPQKSEAISIISEELKIDLSSILTTEKGHVSATYQLEVDTFQQNTKIGFVAHQLLQNSFQVQLNDLDIEAGKVEMNNLFEFWPKPNDSKWMSFGGDVIELDTFIYDLILIDSGYFSFELFDLPEGLHELKVKYEIQPGILDDDFRSFTKIWIVAYSLVPAKYWKSFQDLNIEVLVPKGWELASNVNLTQSKNSYIVSFDSLPAENLLMAVRKDESHRLQSLVYYTIKTLYFILAILVLVLFYWFVKNRYQWKYSKLVLAISTLLIAFLTPVAYFFLEVSQIPLLNRLLDGQVNENIIQFNGYGLIMYMVFLAPIMFFTALMILALFSTILFQYFKKRNLSNR